MIYKNTVLLIAIIFGFWVVKSDISLASAGKSPIHVGFTSSIIKDVQGQLGSKAKRKLIKSDQVYFNENLITSEDSIVVVQFRDGSTLELGPDALMTLDEMIFNPFKGKSIKVVTLLQGSFRYVSGYAAKEAQITIKTAAGTIGIRGSAGSGFYYPGKPAFIHVAKGSATFSNKSGSTNFSSGGSIASLSQVSPLMNPTNMPATVVAEALSHVQASLGKPIGTQPLTAKQQKADAIANAIPTMEALVKFTISDNALCAAGGKALAEALKGNQIMTELNIGSNYLGKTSWDDADLSGVSALANVIPTMGALSSLNLSQNRIPAEEMGSARSVPRACNQLPGLTVCCIGLRSVPSGPSCATIVHTRHTAAIVANISGQVANNKPG